MGLLNQAEGQDGSKWMEIDRTQKDWTIESESILIYVMLGYFYLLL